ncbi:MAG: double-strand break repair protein AddB [Filomicrobium sp.]
MSSNIFTIPSGTPFLPALVRALMSGNLPKPGSPTPDAIDLSGITVLLPTRRAERALAKACLSVTGRGAMLLPKIRAIGGADEDRLLIGRAASASRELGSDAKAAFELPPAIGKTERLLVLTKLVMQWSQSMREASADETGDLAMGPVASAGARTPAQAAAMAGELAELMDLVEREGCSLDGIEDIVPDTFSEHWQKSLAFLQIITKYWPVHLQEQGLLSPKDRDNRLILAEAERLRTNPPAGPVIVAGVTGSIPATVDLMRAVLDLENGAIVLPALDLSLDDESWSAIAPDHPEHPDFGLKHLLEKLDVPRGRVQLLADSAPPKPLSVREHFISETMRPTETTSRWHHWVESADKPALKEALEDVSLLEATSPQEEAEAIALMMRETADHPEKTAALVTPDRLLARRVAIRLEAWGIRVDDSAGRPFAKTVPGAFLELIINAIAKEFSPVATMALLKHPLARFGLSAREVRFAARALELAAFRTTYSDAGFEGVGLALERAEKEVALDERRDMAARRLRDEDWERAKDLLRRMREAFAPLIEALQPGDTLPLSDLAARHAKVAEAASQLTDEELESGVEPQLYAKEAGAAALGFFAELTTLESVAPAIQARDYPDLYRSLIGTLPPVIPRVPKHPRLSIWGPMESQLLSADVMILGGLNETTWPDTTDPGPWLNRPMRAELGLPSPEEDIGREARGFVSLVGANEVFLTRATKVDGVPTVPSRWLMRIKALLGGLDLLDVLSPQQDWLAWARYRNNIAQHKPMPRPEPRPPVSARPRRISVSGIERWIANPYALYANEILKLKVLPPLGAAPDAALKGKILHLAMAQFAKKHPETLPQATARELTDLAKGILEAHISHPVIAAFWVPRFERFAEWFAATEAERRKGFAQTFAEINGDMSFGAPAGDFKITARADRLDAGPDGVFITDYKTGAPPSASDVQSGKRPQLPLEAAIVAAGGYDGLPENSTVLGLRYIHASGGDPPGEQKDIKFKKAELSEVVAEVMAGVQQLVASFDDEATPYAAVRRTGFSYDYDDYAHLARIAEWSQDETSGNGATNGSA